MLLLFSRPDSPSSDGVYVNVTSHKSTHHISHQRLYYVYNPRLILPEYCISVRFVCDTGVKSGRGDVAECSDEELMEMDPQLQNRPKLDKLCDTLHVHTHICAETVYQNLHLQVV